MIVASFLTPLPCSQKNVNRSDESAVAIALSRGDEVLMARLG